MVQWLTPSIVGCFGGAVVLIASMIARPAVEDVVLARAVERQADVVEVDHRVEVAAEREVVRHLAEPGDTDAVVEAHGETRHVLAG